MNYEGAVYYMKVRIRHPKTNLKTLKLFILLSELKPLVLEEILYSYRMLDSLTLNIILTRNDMSRVTVDIISKLNVLYC